MTVHLTTEAMGQLDQAQTEIERHLITGPDGRCKACGELEPCRQRVRANDLFTLYGLLPKRRPGITGVGVKQRDASWFK